MPAKLFLMPTIHTEKVRTVNLPATFTSADIGKAVKLGTTADSYVLCESGDPIEGIVTSVEEGTRGGVKVGGIVCSGYFEVVNKVANWAVGDQVVAGAQPAIGTRNTVVGTKGIEPVSAIKPGTPVTGRFQARIVGFAGGTGAKDTVAVAEFL